MDLIEFEVPSDSESDGNASTESSGTDVSFAGFPPHQLVACNSSLRLGFCVGRS
jgi:hypothetical protein